jgi:hypothetical protein
MIANIAEITKLPDFGNYGLNLMYRNPSVRQPIFGYRLTVALAILEVRKNGNRTTSH